MLNKQLFAILSAVLAFSIWGSFPIFFDFLSFSNPWEIMIHRIIWSSVWILLVLFLSTRQPLKRYRELYAILRKHFGWFLLRAFLISSNWLVFVYAVLQNQVLATSMGYFISPLFTILWGLIFFKERLKMMGILAFILVIVAIVIRFIGEGGEHFPWIEFLLAITFSGYGALHKKSGVSAETSLAIETTVLMPFAIGGLLYFSYAGIPLTFGQTLYTSTLLMASGIVTLIPLFLFIFATKNMRISQIGFLNYLTPSISFILSFTYFSEPISTLSLSVFVLIWIALLLVSSTLNQRSS